VRGQVGEVDITAKVDAHWVRLEGIVGVMPRLVFSLHKEARTMTTS
jgi:hypothetical protein